MQGLPYYYDYINLKTSQINPSTIHVKDTSIERYFENYLLQKVFSVYEFEGLPEGWSKTYFLYTLFCLGYIGVFELDRYGIVCQYGTLAGRDLYYQPNRIIYNNALFRGASIEASIGKNTEIIKLSPNYRGIMDIVGYYASLLALIYESAGMNLINTKLAYVFMADGKADAQAFKKLYDSISNNPMVVADKHLFNDDGKPNWIMFNQDIKASYIVSELMADMHRVMNLFNTEIGIPNANFEKSERLITDEVNANNTDTQSNALLRLETMQEGVQKVNNMFGTNISVRFRFDYEPPEEKFYSVSEEGKEE